MTYSFRDAIYKLDNTIRFNLIYLLHAVERTVFKIFYRVEIVFQCQCRSGAAGRYGGLNQVGVSFKGSQLLILVFAIFVASLGLNTDNVAVIIGAMLISPLMGPIIGMGLGIGISDYGLLQRGLKNILMAMLGSIIASAIYFLISPQYEDGSQLLARTSPSIYDVFIALFGGAAGIVSLACKNKGQVLPGVAIATSLMPPLCTAGYGLATLQPHFFSGRSICSSPIWCSYCLPHG